MPAVCFSTACEAPSITTSCVHITVFFDLPPAAAPGRRPAPRSSPSRSAGRHNPARGRLRPPKPEASEQALTGRRAVPAPLELPQERSESVVAKRDGHASSAARPASGLSLRLGVALKTSENCGGERACGGQGANGRVTTMQARPWSGRQGLPGSQSAAAQAAALQGAQTRASSWTLLGQPGCCSAEGCGGRAPSRPPTRRRAAGRRPAAMMPQTGGRHPFRRAPCPCSRPTVFFRGRGVRGSAALVRQAPAETVTQLFEEGQRQRRLCGRHAFRGEAKLALLP